MTMQEKNDQLIMALIAKEEALKELIELLEILAKLSKEKVKYYLLEDKIQTAIEHAKKLITTS